MNTDAVGRVTPCAPVFAEILILPKETKSLERGKLKPAAGKPLPEKSKREKMWPTWLNPNRQRLARRWFCFALIPKTGAANSGNFTGLGAGCFALIPKTGAANCLPSAGAGGDSFALIPKTGAANSRIQHPHIVVALP